MSRYLITGGAGFIGSHLTAALAARGDRVSVLDDMSTGRAENLEGLDWGESGSGAQVELYRGSILDEGLVARAVEGCRGVLHEAAQVSVPRSVEGPVESLEINVLGTARVLEAARRAGTEAFVMAASSAAYGDQEESPKHEGLPPDPLSPYAVGKLAGEQMLSVYGRLHGMRTVALRYFNVFGPRQRDDSPYTGVIAIIARQLLDALPVTIHGDGEQSRDFTYVDDVVQANLLALEANVAPGRVFNVGAGQITTINGLYSALAELAGVELKASHTEVRAGDVRHSFASLERIRAELGYEPRVAFADGLKRTFDWYAQG